MKRKGCFRENAIRHVEDLGWMGPVAFRFYVKAAIRYFQSDASTYDTDGVSSFAGTLHGWLDRHPIEVQPIASDLASFCEDVLCHYERYDPPQIHWLFGTLRGSESVGNT